MDETGVNTMKIAVYGDSFAGMNTRFFVGSYAPEDAGPAWVELLEDEGNHVVCNFSKPGTAFQYSYEKFLENYKSFDLNIVVVSFPERTHIKALDGILVFGEDWINVEVNRIKKSPWYPSKDRHLRILESVRVYLTDWVDWEMRKHIQHLQVNNLWRLAPNTIVIPGFSSSIEQTTKNLNDLAEAELALVDPEENKINPLGKSYRYKTIVCRRKCHFSKENNRMLYEQIVKAIETGQQILEPDMSLLVKPSKSDYYYYVKLLELPPNQENVHVND